MKDFLGRAARLLAGLAGLGSAICAGLGLAGFLNPWPDVFSHFDPVWAATGLFAVVLGAVVRSRPAVLLGAAGIVLAACLIVPELVSVRPQPVIARPTLRV